MKNKNLLVPLAVVLGLGAVLTRKSTSGNRSSLAFAPTKKKHSSLKLSKELLQEYLERGGRRIFLEFITSSTYVKLRFYGFDSDDSICIQEDLETVKKNVLQTGNIYEGTFSKDDTGVSLHDLLANVPSAQLKDWYLTPVKYKDRDERYVSYDLSDESAPLILKRLDPSPPA